MKLSDPFKVTPVMPSAAIAQVVDGACDTHTHVLGPNGLFPIAHAPDYPLPLAPVARHVDMLDCAGLARGVVVQPTHYGFDASALLDAISAGGGRLRGVAAAEPDIGDDVLDDWHARGVRGLRFVEARAPDGNLRPGAAPFEWYATLAPRMRARGWLGHFWGQSEDIARALPSLLSHDRPIVIEHMGMVKPALGPAHPHFQTLLDSVKAGRAYVKLSLCRCSSRNDFADMRVFHDSLLDANPSQLLWGSDWPFVRLNERAPDVSALLQVVLRWSANSKIAKAILADNPARVFDF